MSRTENKRSGADETVAPMAVNTDGVGPRQARVLTPAARRVSQTGETRQIHGTVVSAAERFQELCRQHLRALSTDV